MRIATDRGASDEDVDPRDTKPDGRSSDEQIAEHRGGGAVSARRSCRYGRLRRQLEHARRGTSQATGQQRAVAALTQFAGCARAHGIPVPDPNSQGEISGSEQLRQQYQNTPQGQATLKACGSYLKDAAAQLTRPIRRGFATRHCSPRAACALTGSRSLTVAPTARSTSLPRRRSTRPRPSSSKPSRPARTCSPAVSKSRPGGDRG
jgi:uncharacterized protein involved in type VI secretion and phage assembly